MAQTNLSLLFPDNSTVSIVIRKKGLPGNHDRSLALISSTVVIHPRTIGIRATVGFNWVDYPFVLAGNINQSGAAKPRM
jgi:hypothetical protein